MSVMDAQPVQKYVKKDLVSDTPTWCSGCGDFAVLAMYFKLLEER